MPEQRQPSATDKVRALLEAFAQRCLTDLVTMRERPQPAVEIQSNDGWTVLVSVFPTPKPIANSTLILSDCERDCLTLLSSSRTPLTAERIRDALEEQGIAVHSEISVKRAMANLHKRLHLVANRRHRPRGYYLPDTSMPLLFYRNGA